MHILYICADRGVPIRGHKGAAVHVRAMTHAFAHAGHQVTIVTPRPGPKDGPIPEANLIHVPLPPRDETLPDETTIRDRQSQAYNERLLTAVTQHHRQHPFDFIYERYSLWSDTGAQFSRQTRLPLVLEVNAPLVEEAARYRALSDYEKALEIESAQFKTAYALSVVSQPLWDYAVSKGASPRHTHVLPNGVDPEQFHPGVRGGKIRDRHNLHGRIVVGFSGRARPWHDLETVIHAAAMLRESNPLYHLLLVGQMPDDIQTQLAQHGLTQATTITGPVPHHEVPGYLAAMNIAVSSHLPLPDFYFSPLKLFEYLACGVPTVAADLGQPAHIIQHGKTGLLYTPGNAASLAQQIQTLVAHPSKARQMAWHGATNVLQNHTWDKNAAAILGLVTPSKATKPMQSSNEPAPPTLPIFDGKLKHRLYRATRPDLAVQFLQKHVPSINGSEVADIVGIEPLKYKPNRRCVLRYDVIGRSRKTGQQTEHTLIGKVFKDDRGLRLHKLQETLWHNGFQDFAPDDVTIPHSWGYVPEMRMQVQAWMPGKTLNELADERDIRPYMSLAAQGIAKLHNLPVPIPPNGSGPIELNHYFLPNEISNLARFTTKLLETRPHAMHTIFSLRDALLAWAKKLPMLPTPTPIHRDYYYSQILFHNERMTIIDLDLFALGDPAIDVANFIAHLHFMGMDKLGGFNALAAEADLFLKCYTFFRKVDETFMERVAFYKAATFFRLLNVVAPRPGLQHLFDPLLTVTAVSLEAA